MPAKALAQIEKLREGNERFTSGNMLNHNFASQRENTSKGQAPDIIILACSDSRIVPHYIFDGEIGEYFIVRKAGNVVGPASLGSIELAADHLGSDMLLVLGHQSCGAVIATIEHNSKSKYIENISKLIQPAVDYGLSLGLKGEELIDKVIWKNVRVQMRSAYSHSAIIRGLVDAGRFVIIGGYYNIITGKAEIFNEAIY